MKAARMHGFGGPEVIELDEISPPQIEGDEVLVRVIAASINPIDYKIRSGSFGRDQKQLPAVLGRDVAGVIENTGLAVKRFGDGEPVYAMLEWDRGGYAEYVAVAEADVARKPDSLDFDTAAAIPLVGLTAWQGLFDHGELASGERVLVHGGAGGVGHFAIQLAKNRGAWVATTVSAQDFDFVRGLGADQPIDYEAQRFDKLVHDIDLVFDLVGGETRERSWAVLKKGGRLVSALGQPSEEEAKKAGARGIGYTAHPDGGELEEIGRLIDAQKVKPYVMATYPLTDVRAAQERAEKEHTRGKIVLSVRPPQAQA